MTVSSRILTAVSATAILAGCSTPVPQVLQAPEVPPAFTGPVAPGAAIWPAADWWQGFGSPEMTSLVTTAEKDNLDIEVAMANVLQAQANTDIQRSALFPDFSLSSTASRARTPGTSITIPTSTGTQTFKSTTTQNSFGLGVNASYQIDFWGLAHDDLRAAEETLKSSRFAQQSVALTTVSSVANTYLDVLALREEIALTQQNADAARRILTVTQAKKTNGISSELDVAEQEATVYGLEAQISPLREQEREAIFALAILLGKPPEGFQIAAKNLNDIKAPVVAPGIPSALLERRPDVAEAEANLASAHASVDAARAAFFPQVGLTGAGGFASSTIGTIINASTLEWSLGASLAQTIFDGGKLIAESDLAKAQQRSLVATYRKTVLTAFSNVETSLGQVSNFGEEQDALQKEVKAASEAFRISELQYREGIVDITSVLQTEQTLFTAENLLVQSKLARAQADVGLFEALGGGWAENPDDKTQVTVPMAAPPPTKS